MAVTAVEGFVACTGDVSHHALSRRTGSENGRTTVCKIAVPHQNITLLTQEGFPDLTIFGNVIIEAVQKAAVFFEMAFHPFVCSTEQIIRSAMAADVVYQLSRSGGNVLERSPCRN